MLKTFLTFAICAFLPSAIAQDLASKFTLAGEVLATVPSDGPIPITITITYVGDETFSCSRLSERNVSFTLPDGTTMKSKRQRMFSPTGFGRSNQLKTGDKLSILIFLHDFAPQLPDGETLLGLNYSLFMDGDQKEIRLSTTIKTKVLPPNPKLFDERISRILEKLNDNPKEFERTNLYKSLLSLSHPKILPVLISALIDGHSNFRPYARDRIVEICSNEKNFNPLVDYLVNHGSRSDQDFLELIKESKLPLVGEQLAKLLRCRDPWIRLFTIEIFGDDIAFQEINVDGIVGSFKNEIDDLGERTKKITVKKLPFKFTFDNDAVKPPRPPEDRKKPKETDDGDF